MTENEFVFECWKARIHAKSTGQTATIWKVEYSAKLEIKKHFTGSGHLMQSAKTGELLFMGLPVKIDTRLPRGRVLLIAGENTVATFDVLDDA